MGDYSKNWHRRRSFFFNFQKVEGGLDFLKTGYVCLAVGKGVGSGMGEGGEGQEASGDL